MLQARRAKLSQLCAETGKLNSSKRLCLIIASTLIVKQPKAQITTIDNLPTTSLESALPSTSAATTLLAPEELFAPPSASAAVARSELTPDQAHAARTKRRKAKQGERKRLNEMAELHGKKPGSGKGKGGVRGEKERALEGLVKSGKGVTVVGKDGRNQSRKRGREEAGPKEDGKRLKL